VHPDVAIFCEETDKQFFTKTPPLIVEVLSKATVLKDLNIKFQLYEEQRVKYYIIIDPDKYIADIFKLQSDRYQLQKKVVQKKIFEFEWQNCKTKLNFGNIFI
jgi:Uma2 family endonuclease